MKEREDRAIEREREEKKMVQEVKMKELKEALAKARTCSSEKGVSDDDKEPLD